MSISAKWVLGLLIATLVGAGLFGAGFWLAQALATRQASTTYPSTYPWSGFLGPGMMGGGRAGGGMMGGFGQSLNVEPLTVDQAKQAVEDYLQALGYDTLEVGEVMIFDNHAYAEVEDPSTGSRAFEVLVDPITRSVFLEYGPSMMWNVEYGMMGSRSRGGYGGMMGGLGMMGPWTRNRTPVPCDPASLTVTPEEAVEIAQDYLDQYLPGLTASDEVDAFPGYYTLHTLQDGEVVGMMSVNGCTGQAWYHSWHGTLLEMSEE